jgi:hypothetical protein
MSSKPEIGMYVILGLVVVNIILTIYCSRRSQEDYARTKSLPATAAPVVVSPVTVATTRPPSSSGADIKLANLNVKSVASMQDANKANLVSIGR